MPMSLLKRFSTSVTTLRSSSDGKHEQTPSPITAPPRFNAVATPIIPKGHTFPKGPDVVPETPPVPTLHNAHHQHPRQPQPQSQRQPLLEAAARVHKRREFLRHSSSENKMAFNDETVKVPPSVHGLRKGNVQHRMPAYLGHDLPLPEYTDTLTTEPGSEDADERRDSGVVTLKSATATRMPKSKAEKNSPPPLKNDILYLSLGLIEQPTSDTCCQICEQGFTSWMRNDKAAWRLHSCGDYIHVTCLPKMSSRSQTYGEVSKCHTCKSLRVQLQCMDEEERAARIKRLEEALFLWKVDVQ
ncbi:hypothetical protein K458DRAFT_406678 [Lentithecium fluviatile CBS 122367]|uniref:Uncharacterized protein n=1 Tax=Lentithecium fluviatile CBS 122367 TaxID=1168545 RepID=A0A6G1ISW5_9PLEO|nr:hypothetical protein K458DRAFT_406678 [Lentithecium fluviatile CBS 122367]